MSSASARCHPFPADRASAAPPRCAHRPPPEGDQGRQQPRQHSLSSHPPSRRLSPPSHSPATRSSVDPRHFPKPGLVKRFFYCFKSAVEKYYKCPGQSSFFCNVPLTGRRRLSRPTGRRSIRAARATGRRPGHPAAAQGSPAALQYHDVATRAIIPRCNMGVGVRRGRARPVPAGRMRTDGTVEQARADPSRGTFSYRHAVLRS